APQTTLSRVPLLHSYEPRDSALPLRRHAEDTGLGSTPPPSSAPHARSEDCADTAAAARCLWVVVARGGVGGEGVRAHPVLYGELKMLRRLQHADTPRERDEETLSELGHFTQHLLEVLPIDHEHA